MSDDASDEARKLDVFFGALEHEESAERAAFLDAECAGDRTLRRWVENELRAQTGAGTGFDETLIATATPVDEEPPPSPEVEALFSALKPEEPGERIGPYKLVRQLGEGGFGTVWMAEQEKPVRREVALKILKPGMDSRQIIGRFEQERQALAMLDHPGIAKVFDAGATPTGRPFFAMELVPGEPITEFCDAARLTVRARLELLMRVCFAVQHAHQKGIIHRDLKPSNIVVARLNDETAAPKVIDLGLAKATLELPSEHTLIVTLAERMIGTPLYMSPEQAAGSRDIDTRTDIYSLGAILYELLTGRTPHDANEMARRSHEQIQQAIREEEPAPPSSALRAMSDGARAGVAHRSSAEPAQHLRAVRGELDAICMKALEKDRRRRYASAANFAADLQAHLLNEPISARRRSRWYRFRKFAARNRRGVIATAAVAAAILLGSFVSIREALRAKAAEQRALEAQEEEVEQRQLAELQRGRAEEERTAARLNEYVADVGLAQQSLNAGNLGRAVQLLEKHRTASGGADLRDWAWRYLWKLAQGEPHIPLPPHSEFSRALAFSPAGDLLAAGGLHAVTVRDVRKRELAATLAGGAESVAFFPDGRTLGAFASAGARLWEVGDWTERATPLGELRGVFAFSPSGARLATADADGVKLRDAASGRELLKLPGARPPLVFAADSQTLATDSEDGITLWPVAGGSPRVLNGSYGVLAGSGGEPMFKAAPPMAFAASGAELVAVQNQLTERGVFILRVWNTKTARAVAVMPDDPERPEHTGAITALAVSPDGRTLATTSLDHSVRLWDVARRRRTATLQGHRAEVGAAAFSADGETLATCDRLGQVKLWSVRRDAAEDAIAEIIRPLGFSRDGRTLAALTTANAVGFYDVQSRERRSEIALGGVVAVAGPSLAVSGDLNTLAQGLGDGSVKLWNTTTGETRIEKIGAEAVELVALTPGGQTLITGSRGGPLRTRDLRTGANGELPFAAGRVFVSPDGGTLAAFVSPQKPAGAAESISGPPDGDAVVLWDFATAAVRARFPGKKGEATDAAFSPDGRTFALGGADNLIKLWNAATGEPLGVCTGHKQIVRAVAFSADGRTLASTSDDSTLRLWNVETQQELLSFQALGNSMAGLLFSPDGDSLAVVRTNPGQSRSLEFRRAPASEEAAPAAAR